MALVDRALHEHLQQFLTPRRRRRFAEVLAQRTRHVTLVLEDVHHPQNVSAVLRTCDALGVQDVHVIEGRNPYQVNPDVALGADRWLTVRRYAGPDAARRCAAVLQARGYRLLAAAPRRDGAPLEALDPARPLALLIGNERVGVTAELLEQAEGLVHVPMYGFVGSFNLSVAAALCLQSLTARLRGGGIDWRLTAEEREELLFTWTRQSVPHVEQIEARFFSLAGRPALGDAGGRDDQDHVRAAGDADRSRRPPGVERDAAQPDVE